MAICPFEGKMEFDPPHAKHVQASFQKYKMPFHDLQLESLLA